MTNSDLPIDPVQPPIDQEVSPKSPSNLKNILQTIALLALAPILALFLTSHVFQPYEVDGASMETTLHNGDRLIVYKLPKTLSNIMNKPYTPSRWDVVVFDRPSSLVTSDATDHLIKRVIGLPGERVVVKDGSVTVYNKDYEQGFNPDEGKEYAKDILTTDRSADITVGANQVFVMGDNRTNSADSRMFGPIATSSIVGKATSRFIPVGSMKKL